MPSPTSTRFEKFNRFEQFDIKVAFERRRWPKQIWQEKPIQHHFTFKSVWSDIWQVNRNGFWKKKQPTNKTTTTTTRILKQFLIYTKYVYCMWNKICLCFSGTGFLMEYVFASNLLFIFSFICNSRIYFTNLF